MIPTNITLYKKVKKEADNKFLAPTSVYKSAWIIKQYKQRGGTFHDKKPDHEQGLTRWFREKWVDINRKNEPCGRAKATLQGVYPLCRPSVRINKQTPKLVSELSKENISKAKKEKQKVKQTKNIKF